MSHPSRFLPIFYLAILAPIAACSPEHSTATPVITPPETSASTSASPAASPEVSAKAAPAPASASASSLPPSGIYQLDPNHASVTYKISHLGFSRYTGRFDKIEGVLSLNAVAPADSSLEATVETSSIDNNNPKLDEDLRGDKWFNVIAFPRATFVSKEIKLTSPTTAKVTGDFSMLGETHSLTLDVTLVGHGLNSLAGKQDIGFSATGSLRRSDYGLTNLLPMVGDDVTLEIEAEFDKAE